MTTAFRLPLIVWLALLTLSAISFTTQMESRRTAAAVILTLALTKSLLLLWHFMELRHAHMLWRTVLALVTVLPVAILFVLL